MKKYIIICITILLVLVGGCAKKVIAPTPTMVEGQGDEVTPPPDTTEAPVKEEPTPTPRPIPNPTPFVPHGS